jgi:hypothetical protein
VPRADEFDRICHLLQTETPVFFTALNLLTIRAFNVSTGAELPDEGPADDALVALAAQLRNQLGGVADT